jgi:hypothetical protein
MKVCDHCSRNDTLLEPDEHVKTFLLRFGEQYSPLTTEAQDFVAQVELCPKCFPKIAARISKILLDATDVGFPN